MRCRSERPLSPDLDVRQDEIDPPRLQLEGVGGVGAWTTCTERFESVARTRGWTFVSAIRTRVGWIDSSCRTSRCRGRAALASAAHQDSRPEVDVIMVPASSISKRRSHHPPGRPRLCLEAFNLEEVRIVVERRSKSAGSSARNRDYQQRLESRWRRRAELVGRPRGRGSLASSKSPTRARSKR